MPTKNKNAAEQQNDNLNDTSQEILTKSIVQEQIYISCGVNRRINIGNFEHLDVYVGVAAPLGTDFENLNEQLSTSIAEAMKVASTETNERYQMVKQAQAEARGR
jgi:hypothetical protein